MARINEMKTIMRKLKESKNESVLNANEEVDTWTNISLVNTSDLSSEYGKLNKLICFNNVLLAF